MKTSQLFGRASAFAIFCAPASANAHEGHAPLSDAAHAVWHAAQSLSEFSLGLCLLAAIAIGVVLRRKSIARKDAKR